MSDWSGPLGSLCNYRKLPVIVSRKNPGVNHMNDGSFIIRKTILLLSCCVHHDTWMRAGSSPAPWIHMHFSAILIACLNY